MADKITSEQYEHAMNDILAIYSQAENEMMAKVAKRVKRGVTEEGWNESYLKQVQSMNVELSKTMGHATALVQSKVATHAKNEYNKAVDISFDDEISDYVKEQALAVGKYMQSNYATGISKVVQNSKGFAKGNSNAYMFVDNKDPSVLHINPAKFKGKTKEEIDAMIKADSGVLHSNADLGSIISHEYGHVIDMKMNGKQKMHDILGGKSPDEAAKAISKYAGVSEDELFAEAIADYYKNGDNATPFAKELGKAMETVSRSEVEKRLKEEYGPITYSKFLESANIPMNLKQLVKATNNMIGDASLQVLRNANDAYKQVMGNAATGLMAGTDTRIQASQKMLNEFASRGITTFKDKAGRNWDLGSYSEMCARTVSNHAALQGHIDRAKATGRDLMKVSSIDTTCPICASWEGVVLSVSGNSSTYPSLDSACASGLFHPNCKHTLGIFIPEIDGVGKSTQNVVSPGSRGQIRNRLIEQQRSNERNIRYWKKRSSMGITEVDRAKANDKVRYWQHRNLLFCEQHNLRRQYAREGVRVGNAEGIKGTEIGDLESFYRDVVGGSPKETYKALKVDPSKVTYEKWIRSEIKDLSTVDIELAWMKDASNKKYTPTTMYKKYISDSPSDDFKALGGETGTGMKYAKWLTEQCKAIGTGYKLKPEFVEVTEDIPKEDRGLSATAMYKKYMGKLPTEEYKSLGGESGTGMAYGRWIETEKKKMLSKGITKTVPFDSVATEKTSKVIASAKETVDSVTNKRNETLLEGFRKQFESISDPKMMSRELKAASDLIESSKGLDKVKAQLKYKAAMEHDIELTKALAKASKGGTVAGSPEYESDWLKTHILSRTDISDAFRAHVKEKVDIWEARDKEIKEEERVRKAKQAHEAALKANLDLKFASSTKEELKDALSLISGRSEDDKFTKAFLKAKISDFDAQEKRALAAAAAAKKRQDILDKMTSYFNERSGNDASFKRNYESSVDYIANALKVSNKEAKQMLDDDLAMMFQECELGSRVKGSVLKLILDDDPNIQGFKNLFETGTGGGCTNQSVRAKGENAVFGYKGKDASFSNNLHERPFYGMMMPEFRPDTESYYTNGPGSGYGDGITVIFNKAILPNVSFTLGDSLDYQRSVVGCESTAPEFRGCHSDFENSYIKAKQANDDPSHILMKVGAYGDEYLELQYHGDASRKEMINFIEHVYIEGSRPDLEQLLDKKNIPYTII